jgi:hypothetical protein
MIAVRARANDARCKIFWWACLETGNIPTFSARKEANRLAFAMPAKECPRCYQLKPTTEFRWREIRGRTCLRLFYTEH